MDNKQHFTTKDNYVLNVGDEISGFLLKEICNTNKESTLKFEKECNVPYKENKLNCIICVTSEIDKKSLESYLNKEYEFATSKEVIIILGIKPLINLIR